MRRPAPRRSFLGTNRPTPDDAGDRRAADPRAHRSAPQPSVPAACMLGGLALKRRWARRNAGRYGAGARPNLVMGVNVQVCWKKFCDYWEIEPRLVPMEGDRFHLGAEEAVEACDENAIGMVAGAGQLPRRRSADLHPHSPGLFPGHRSASHLPTALPRGLRRGPGGAAGGGDVSRRTDRGAFRH
ncbi:pyridoxal-dependent decarboxylase [Actinoallomurus sp. CA-142502]|uniref:pyridoxal-dependent decarboxylase n=1 Tax=Actinoallomurus sp. CA-142502 TaxID=3239885 RepID=UPI003D9325E4